MTSANDAEKTEKLRVSYCKRNENWGPASSVYEWEGFYLVFLSHGSEKVLEYAEHITVIRFSFVSLLAAPLQVGRVSKSLIGIRSRESSRRGQQKNHDIVCLLMQMSWNVSTNGLSKYLQSHHCKHTRKEPQTKDLVTAKQFLSRFFTSQESSRDLGFDSASETGHRSRKLKWQSH